MSASCNIQVFARVRPYFDSELGGDKLPAHVVSVEGNSISVPSSKVAGSIASGAFTSDADMPLLISSDKKRTFTFDMCFCGIQGQEQRPTQEDLYAHLGPSLVSCAMDGFNGCLLAYGQTGSGKTHSMMGPGNSTKQRAATVVTHHVDPLEDSSDCAPFSACVGVDSDVPACDGRGIIPRLVDSLFQAASVSSRDMPSQASSTRFSVRYFEVYCEKVYDLLQSKAPEIVVRCNGSKLEGIREEIVTCAQSTLHLLKVGDRNRSVAATLKNERSSRSHAVFQIITHRDFVISTDEGDGTSASTVRSIESVVSLVDLAGSERAKQSGAEGQQFKEMVNINQSLSTLRRVIQVLHDNAALSQRAGGIPGERKKSHIAPPLRESVLTQVLGPCFGGNSKTFLILALSPSLRDLNDTVSSLEFGCVARKVVNKVSVNEDKQQALMRSMADEIARLKEMLSERKDEFRRSVSRASMMVPSILVSNRRSIAIGTDETVGSEDEPVACDDVEDLHAREPDTTNTEVTSSFAIAMFLDQEKSIGELQCTLDSTLSLYSALQQEVARHVQTNYNLTMKLEMQEGMVAALRQQVEDIEKAFESKLECLLGDISTGRQRDVTCDDESHFDSAAVLRQSYEETLSVVNATQETLYCDMERIRRAHLQTVALLADARNCLNVQEDKDAIIALQSRRIEELEAQVEHHLQERLTLTMENHRLKGSSNTDT